MLDRFKKNIYIYIYIEVKSKFKTKNQRFDLSALNESLFLDFE